MFEIKQRLFWCIISSLDMHASTKTNISANNITEPFFFWINDDLWCTEINMPLHRILSDGSNWCNWMSVNRFFTHQDVNHLVEPAVDTLTWLKHSNLCDSVSRPLSFSPILSLHRSLAQRLENRLFCSQCSLKGQMLPCTWAEEVKPPHVEILFENQQSEG